jgi:hypothetical protein
MFEDQENKTVSIDFDGVIHKCSKGFYDGTVYDDPVEGSLEAIKKLNKKYTIVIFTAKAKAERPLINNKTGKELVCDWLDKHGYSPYISDVTSEKPRSFIYIDDRGYRFKDWENTLKFLENND